MSDVAAKLAEQCRLQGKIDRRRMTWWIPLIFVAGFGVSALGLYALIGDWRAQKGTTAAFAFFTLTFGAGIIMWLIEPLMRRPRIVPYFARELAPFGGRTTPAFRRGRALFLEAEALDSLAESLAVTPLSTFGFEYDYYDQSVRWHDARSALATVDALLRNLDTRAAAALRDDLEALATSLQTAENREVPFSLVVRLHRKDNIQMVSTREVRQGSFW